MPHPAGRANGEHSELAAAANELVGEGGENPSTGGTEWMADGDRAAHDVELRAIDLAEWRGVAGATRPLLGLEAAQITKHLGGEGFVHFDEVQIAEREAGTLQGDRRGEHGTHQQLFARIERRV